MPVVPNFFIVGAPKSGTTSLYHYLDQHPQVYMSPIKEPCYFASELRPENFSEREQHRVKAEMRALRAYLRRPIRSKRFGGLVTEWDDYLKLFSGAASEQAVGEASVCYLWSETAAANIARTIPTARIVMILRDPAERAFSQYLHGITAGLVSWSFRDHIQANLRCTVPKFGQAYPFLEFGLYYEQVTRYLDRFPNSNIFIRLYDEYRQQPMAVIADLLRFLGFSRDFMPDMARRHLEPRIPRFTAPAHFLKNSGVAQLAKRLCPQRLQPLLRSVVYTSTRPVIDPADRAFLVDYYQEDIRKLSRLLACDLTAWLQRA